jgi:hypothetical protein
MYVYMTDFVGLSTLLPSTKTRAIAEALLQGCVDIVVTGSWLKSSRRSLAINARRWDLDGGSVGVY